METPEPDLLPPVLALRYEALRRLGGGSFGRVVLARDRELERTVAIKVMRESLPDLELRLRFEREGRITSRLHHPHVVKVYDSGFAGAGLPYIVYEYVEGATLAQRRAAGPVEPARVTAWGRQLAGALREAHELGILHRDVKPANVLIRDADGAAVLCDFGIARVEAGRTVETREGMILGTPEFMAPEVLMGAPPSPGSDQFSLAATLAYALHGEGPYGRLDLRGILGRVREARPVVLPPGSPALDAVLARALAFDPARRYPRLVDLEHALARALVDGPALPPAGGPAAVPAAKPGLDRASLLALGLGLGLVLALSRTPPDPTRVGREPPPPPRPVAALEGWLGQGGPGPAPDAVWDELDRLAADLAAPDPAAGLARLAALQELVDGLAPEGSASLRGLLDAARVRAPGIAPPARAVAREALLASLAFRRALPDPVVAEAVLEGSRDWLEAHPPGDPDAVRGWRALMVGLQAATASPPDGPSPGAAALAALAAAPGLPPPYAGILDRLERGRGGRAPDPGPRDAEAYAGVLLETLGRPAAALATAVADRTASEWDKVHRLLGDRRQAGERVSELVFALEERSFAAAAAAALAIGPTHPRALLELALAERYLFSLARGQGGPLAVEALGPRHPPALAAARSRSALGQAALGLAAASPDPGLEAALATEGGSWVAEVGRYEDGGPADLAARLAARFPAGSIAALAIEGRGAWLEGRYSGAAEIWGRSLATFLGEVEAGGRWGGPGQEPGLRLLEELSGWCWRAGQRARDWERQAALAARALAALDRFPGRDPAGDLPAKLLLRRADCLRALGRTGELAGLDEPLRRIRDAPPSPGLARHAEKALSREPLKLGSP